MNAKGTWTLVIKNTSTTSGTGTFNGWSLSFQKPLPTTGLGEPGSDNIGASFRLFRLGQTDALSSQAWTAVGSAAIGSSTGSGGETSVAGGAGRVTGWRSIRPIPRGTPSSPPAPAAASGRRPTS